MKRLKLTRRIKRYHQARLQWSRLHRHWNLRSWKRIHWSDESQLLLKLVDGRMRVWRERNTALNSNKVHGTTAYGGGGVTVWGCFSNDCKLPLQVIDGTLNGQKYRDDILDSHVLPHFENHALADRPVFQDDNARPHRARIVRDFIEAQSIETFPWPSRSPDINLIEHVWDFIGRKINQRQPKCQNLNELRVALIAE